MAKSIRSKSKRSFRAKKRQSGKYAAADAARLDRLHTKLAAAKDRASLPLDAEKDEDAAKDQHMAEEGQGQGQVQGAPSIVVQDGDGIILDEPQRPVAVSTHGTRGSRREEWQKSKGMHTVQNRHGMNRQGGMAARRKAGRPSRRR